MHPLFLLTGKSIEATFQSDAPQGTAQRSERPRFWKAGSSRLSVRIRPRRASTGEAEPPFKAAPARLEVAAFRPAWPRKRQSCCYPRVMRGIATAARSTQP